MGTYVIEVLYHLFCFRGVANASVQWFYPSNIGIFLDQSLLGITVHQESFGLYKCTLGNIVKIARLSKLGKQLINMS